MLQTGKFEYFKKALYFSDSCESCHPRYLPKLKDYIERNDRDKVNKEPAKEVIDSNIFVPVYNLEVLIIVGCYKIYNDVQAKETSQNILENVRIQIL